MADVVAPLAATATLEGRVWVEQTANLRFDAGDRPLAAVHLHLANEQGQVVATARTDSVGNYRFEGLPAGRYVLTEIQPSRIEQGREFAGSAGGVAAGANTIRDILLQAGDVARDYDFLELVGDSVAPLDADGAPPLLSQGNIVPTSPVTSQPVGVPGDSTAESAASPADLSYLFYSTTPAGGETPQTPLGKAPAPISPAAAPPSAPPPTFPVESPPVLIGGGKRGATWELSLVERFDADEPESGLVVSQSRKLSPLHSTRLQQGLWLLPRLQGEEVTVKEIVFGHRGALPLVGDFDADGDSDLGLYLRGEWLARLSDNNSPEDVRSLGRLGAPGDRPVAGDWDGNGRCDIGVFRGLPVRSESFGDAVEPTQQRVDKTTDSSGRAQRLSDASAGLPAKAVDQVLRFGSAADLPVTGDWTGKGVAQIGAFRSGVWRLDLDGDGRFSSADQEFTYGQAGDQPVIGDLNGDGIAEVGVFRQGVWTLDTNGNRQLDPQDTRLQFGQAGDTPVVGDWDGDGCQEPGIYREAAGSAAPSGANIGDLPVIRWLQAGE